MAVSYLVVSSGTTPLSESALNYYGTSSWELIEVLRPSGTIGYSYIFKK